MRVVQVRAGGSSSCGWFKLVELSTTQSIEPNALCFYSESDPYPQVPIFHRVPALLRSFVTGYFEDFPVLKEFELPDRQVEELVVDLLRSPAGIEPLSKLVQIDPLQLDRAGRIDYLSALEKQTAWLQALMQSAIVAVAGDEPTSAESLYSGVDEAEREEVATALRLSGNTAQIRIDVARTLTTHLPVTCSALATGEISAAHANVIARESAEMINRGVSPEIIAGIEAQAVAHSEFHTPAQVATKVRNLIARNAPEQFQEIVETAKECRRVNLYPEADGMATLVALLPVPDAQTIMLAIDKLARKAKAHDQEVALMSKQSQGEVSDKGAMQGKINIGSDHLNAISIKKSIDAYRADALTELAASYLAQTEETGLHHRRPVTLNLTLDLPTALGLANNPGQLAGYGPIPASIARELAADGKWRRFITEPITGTLLDYGRQSYEPPQALVDFLMARDRTCRFPGCRQPARISDIDHAIPWEEGGETNLENLGLLCRRHHRLKTHGDWKLTSHKDGSCEWISPLGKKYYVPARPINDVA